jgi:hypothetical protein
MDKSRPVSRHLQLQLQLFSMLWRLISGLTVKGRRGRGGW